MQSEAMTVPYVLHYHKGIVANNLNGGNLLLVLDFHLTNIVTKISFSHS